MLSRGRYHIFLLFNGKWGYIILVNPGSLTNFFFSIANFSFLVIHQILFSQTQHERHENTQLRTENEKLRADNMRYREALSNASCPNCGGPTAIGEMSFDEHHLRLENARLREEVQ